jgi:flagellar motor protein MotB
MGAWKVAYADFVTAMMALFIVLWLMNSSNQVKEAVGEYFNDPPGNSKMVGSDLRGTSAGTGQVAESRGDRRRYGLQALSSYRAIHELGAIRRSRECSAKTDDAERLSRAIPGETSGGGEANGAGASSEKSAQGEAKQESTGGGEPAAPKKE